MTKKMDAIQVKNFMLDFIANKQFENIPDLVYYLNNHFDSFQNDIDEFESIVDGWGDEENEEFFNLEDWEIGEEYEELSVNRNLIFD